MQKELKCFVTKKDGGNKFTAYASTLSVDRDYDIVMPDSYVAHKEVFMKNPVLLQFHDYWKEPVGKIVDLRHDGNGIIMDIEFAPTEDGEKFAKLYNGGFMSAFSIGFIGKNYVSPNEKEFEDIAEANSLSNESRVSRIYTEIELLEISCVPVPSNRDAVVIGAKSFIEENGVDSFDDLMSELRELHKTAKGDSMTLEEIKALIEEKGLSVEEVKSLAEEHGLSAEDTESLVKEIEGAEDGDEGEGNEEPEEKTAVSEVVAEIAEQLKEMVEDIVESAVAEIESANDQLAEELKSEFAAEVKALGDIVTSKKQAEREEAKTKDALSSILDGLKELKNSEEVK
jgi:HK97 family phage prohead protease